MYIHGIGIISSVGRGLEAHRVALTSSPVPISFDVVHRVSEIALKDPILAKDARRSGRAGHVLRRLEAERAMLHVNDDEIEPDHPRHLHPDRVRDHDERPNGDLPLRQLLLQRVLEHAISLLRKSWS